MRNILTILLASLWYVALCEAQTTCQDIRSIDQEPQPVYYVECTDGNVVITIEEFNSNKNNNAAFAQFCPNGPANPGARGELRWQTTSGFPETCDVFTTDPRVNVKVAAFVYFVHNDGYEQEIDTSIYALVYQGNDLINFNPPVPGIILAP